MHLSLLFSFQSPHAKTYYERMHNIIHLRAISVSTWLCHAGWRMTEMKNWWDSVVLLIVFPFPPSWRLGLAVCAGLEECRAWHVNEEGGKLVRCCLYTALPGSSGLKKVWVQHGHWEVLPVHSYHLSPLLPSSKQPQDDNGAYQDYFDFSSPVLPKSTPIRCFWHPEHLKDKAPFPCYIHGMGGISGARIGEAKLITPVASPIAGPLWYFEQKSFLITWSALLTEGPEFNPWHFHIGLERAPVWTPWRVIVNNAVLSRPMVYLRLLTIKQLPTHLSPLSLAEQRGSGRCTKVVLYTVASCFVWSEISKGKGWHFLLTKSDEIDWCVKFAEYVRWWWADFREWKAKLETYQPEQRAAAHLHVSLAHNYCMICLICMGLMHIP